VNFEEAQRQLRYALRNQKTISIDKLNKLMQSMNISTKRSTESHEIEYLKGEIKRLKRECNCG